MLVFNKDVVVGLFIVVFIVVFETDISELKFLSALEMRTSRDVFVVKIVDDGREIS